MPIRNFMSPKRASFNWMEETKTKEEPSTAVRVAAIDARAAETDKIAPTSVQPIDVQQLMNLGNDVEPATSQFIKILKAQQELSRTENELKASEAKNSQANLAALKVNDIAISVMNELMS